MEREIPTLLEPPVTGCQAAFIRVKALHAPDRGALVISIPLSGSRPHWMKHDPDERAYVRAGEHSHPMTRVPYHQNVFDLLTRYLEPDRGAARTIETWERRTSRRVPESVRQWYSLRGARQLPFQAVDKSRPLSEILAGLEGRQSKMPVAAPYVLLTTEIYCAMGFSILPDGSDDPPVYWVEGVWNDEEPLEWQQTYPSFSDWVFTCVACNLQNEGQAPEHWLRSPADEPLAPPVQDYLLEHYKETFRLESGGLMSCQLTGEGCKILITTDAHGTRGGRSAWWLQADSERDLLALAKSVWRWGTLSQTLTSGWPSGGSPSGAAVLKKHRKKKK